MVIYIEPKCQRSKSYAIRYAHVLYQRGKITFCECVKEVNSVQSDMRIYFARVEIYGFLSLQTYPGPLFLSFADPPCGRAALRHDTHKSHPDTTSARTLMLIKRGTIYPCYKSLRYKTYTIMSGSICFAGCKQRFEETCGRFAPLHNRHTNIFSVRRRPILSHRYGSARGFPFPAYGELSIDPSTSPPMKGYNILPIPCRAMGS